MELSGEVHFLNYFNPEKIDILKDYNVESPILIKGAAAPQQNSA